MPLFKRNPSLAEIEEETERQQAENGLLGTKLSIAQKKMAIAELKKRGLTPKHFGDTALGSTWNRIISWLKEH